MGKSIVGFLCMALISGYLYASSLSQAVSSGALAGAVLLLIVLGLLSGYFFEWSSVSRAKGGLSLGPAELKVFLSVIGGALASYYLNTRVGLGAVLGEGLVLMLAALILPAFGAPIGSGAFLGMVSAKVLPGFGHLLLAAAIAGVVNILAKDVMNGFGGKLGAMGAIGCVIATLLTGNKFTTASPPDWSVGQYVVLVVIVGAVASYVINTRLKHGPVMAAGIISVLGGVIFPPLFPKIGATLAVASAFGAVTGMSSRARIPGEGFVALAGALVGLVYVYGSPFLGGVGGKAGATALGSVMAVWGGLGLWRRLACKRSESPGA